MVSDQGTLSLFGEDPAGGDDSLPVSGRRIPLRLVKNPRAKRYLLRLAPDGAARVTVPRAGNAAEARRFALRHAAWLERQLLRRARSPGPPASWAVGTEILFRGEPVRLELQPGPEGTAIRFADQVLPAPPPGEDLRPTVEAHLQNLAMRELPARLLELAAAHGLTVRRVTVRAQRSRWGSCSARGTISLNWRLIQTPPPVSDYILLHELAHRRHMNHSARFWAEVGRLCPGFPAAEEWLKRHGGLLRHPGGRD